MEPIPLEWTSLPSALPIFGEHPWASLTCRAEAGSAFSWQGWWRCWQRGCGTGMSGCGGASSPPWESCSSTLPLSSRMQARPAPGLCRPVLSLLSPAFSSRVKIISPRYCCPENIGGLLACAASAAGPLKNNVLSRKLCKIVLSSLRSRKRCLSYPCIAVSQVCALFGKSTGQLLCPLLDYSLLFLHNMIQFIYDNCSTMP